MADLEEVLQQNLDTEEKVTLVLFSIIPISYHSHLILILSPCHIAQDFCPFHLNTLLSISPFPHLSEVVIYHASL